MASTKDLKKRIGSVKNTQQTTRAMKMVSAAKLRRAQEAITQQRPYARKVGGLIHRLAGMSQVPFESPLLRQEDAGGKKRKLLLIVVTSDRGLCGGFNGNIIRAAQRWLQSNLDKYESISFGFVGRRGYDFFKTKKVTLGPNYTDASGKVAFAKARKLSEDVVRLFLSGEYDEVKFLYNEFKNAVSQKPVVENFLPILSLDDFSEADESGVADLMLIKPSAAAVLEALLAKNFSIQAFRILLESQASEHGARMSAMENATKNAGEMIRKLTLQYNKQRQAGITTQLMEIISGSESQKTAS